MRKEMAKIYEEIYFSIQDLKEKKVNADWIEKHVGNEIKLQEVEIETVNRCNGKCSFCPVNVNQPQRPYAKMSDELFEKIINDLAEINYAGKISLFSNNEPFLDERIIDFHLYARKKLPNAYFNLFSNGSLLNVDKFIKLIDCLDSFTIDNYNDDLNVNSGLVEVYNYINEHPKYKEKVNFSMRLENEVLTSRGGEAPNKKKGRKLRAQCLLPFRQMIIRPTGEVSLCCNDALGKMTLGNVQKEHVMNVWNSVSYKEIRKIMREQGRKGISLCQYCDTRTSPIINS